MVMFERIYCNVRYPVSIFGYFHKCWTAGQMIHVASTPCFYIQLPVSFSTKLTTTHKVKKSQPYFIFVMKSVCGGGRKMFGPPPSAVNVRNKERDDKDLVLFREMHKREKERFVSLLQPVSDEFEPSHATGNYALYRIGSAKKVAASGYDFLAETTNNKNDYDWLKTPPATPLFPSLEMESGNNAPELAVHRELPILQPLSRFSSNSEAPTKAVNDSPKAPTPKPNKVPHRAAITPSRRSNNSLSAAPKPAATNNSSNHMKLTPFSNHPHGKRSNVNVMTKTQNPKPETYLSNYLTSNLSKNATSTDASKTKPKSRGVSPQVVRPTISGFSEEIPPNLRTDRSSSASRGRPANNPTIVVQQKPVEQAVPSVTVKAVRRQSCSPSMTRGRKQESEGQGLSVGGRKTQKSGGNYGTTHVLGSRMVEKVMNARKLNAQVEEKESTRPRSSRDGLAGVNVDSSGGGFGRLMSKSSLDMALKHMETKLDQTNPRQLGTTLGKQYLNRK